MNGINVTITDMMNCRDRRVSIQNELISKYDKPVLSFCMNIPGPVKVPDGVPQAFATGCRRIEALLKDRLVLVQHMETIKEKTGYEAFYCIDANPEFIKTLMVTLEDQDRLGRLFDIDVIRPDGSKVSREELGRPSRTCLLCKEPAHACSRSRRHSVAELTAEIGHILKDLY